MRKSSGATSKGLNTSRGAGKLVRRKVDVQTVCIVLEMDEAASARLKETQRLYGEACNLIVPSIVADKDRSKRLWQRYNLHHEVYHSTRAAIPALGSQLTCNVIRSVSSAYKTWISNHSKFDADKSVELPVFKFSNPVIHLDKNTIAFFNRMTSASIYTCEGRVTAKLRPGAYQAGKLAGYREEELAGLKKSDRKYKLGECNLVWKRGIKGSASHWELHIALERKLPEVDLSNLKEAEVMGVDVGENNAAATSLGRLCMSGKMKNDRDKYLSSRSRLQRNGSQSARQALRRASGRERRHVEHINDEISKSIVQDASSRGIRLVVMEDLTHIRERIRSGQRVRARLHRWPFRELQQKIADKAARAGMEVIFVDPRYTSKTCPRCKTIGTRSKHRFKCPNCGYLAHSDLNASRNLQGLGYLLVSQGLL